MRRRWLMLAPAVTLIAAGVTACSGGNPLLGRDEECVAAVDDNTATIELDQAENAALIAAVATRRGLPARAVTIAIATAFQESKLRNIDYGDRDSVGLFQQRPSQGWGTVKQIMDREYAIGKFFDALVKIKNYRELDITVAAQKVQRSAFPDAYAQHEPEARALASALSGNSPHALTCEIGNPEAGAEKLAANGLTTSANRVRKDVSNTYGSLSLGGFAPAGVTDGHRPGSAHYEGRAIDVFFRPINGDNNRRGWALAHYLVANADRLNIATVIFDEKIWTARRSPDGWRDYTVTSTTGNQDILLHRDHVHVDVA
ncbi:hypothetical protein BH09ACT10_BH09ACT10_17100 [soil metagenome]